MLFSVTVESKFKRRSIFGESHIRLNIILLKIQKYLNVNVYSFIYFCPSIILFLIFVALHSVKKNITNCFYFSAESQMQWKIMWRRRPLNWCALK